MMDRSDDKFVKEAKALFDDSVDGLDAATLSTLNRSRHRALEAAGNQHPALLRWVPVTGVAVAALVAVMVIEPGPNGVDALPAGVDDMEILLGEDSIEMLEDLEFYATIDALEQDDDVG
jgi:hypothetical protein